MKKTLYFVRHGETDWNVLGKLQGRTDVPLNENGIMQARELSERIDIKIDYIFSSPLIRAYNTACILAEKLGVEVSKNPLLCEVNFGDLEGKVIPESLDKTTAETWDIPFPNGESFKDAFIRFNQFLEQISSSMDNVLVVSHGGILRVVLRCFDAGEIRLKNCVCIACDYDMDTKKLSNFRCI